LKKLQDFYFHKAKREGFLARSIFKLEEIDQKYHLIHPKMSIIELGAAPGSWLQYCQKKVGPQGRIFAFDLQKIEFSASLQVLFQKLDATALLEKDWQENYPTVDLILSDMAPKTSGIKTKDAYDAFLLAEKAYHIACWKLKPGGSLLTKTFQGEKSKELLMEMKNRFEKAMVVKPKSSRSESTEIFLLGLKFQNR